MSVRDRRLRVERSSFCNALGEQTEEVFETTRRDLRDINLRGLRPRCCADFHDFLTVQTEHLRKPFRQIFLRFRAR